MRKETRRKRFVLRRPRGSLHKESNGVGQEALPAEGENGGENKCMVKPKTNSYRWGAEVVNRVLSVVAEGWFDGGNAV